MFARMLALSLLAAASYGGAIQAARASLFTITIVQDGNNVDATGTGSINESGLSFDNFAIGGAGISDYGVIQFGPLDNEPEEVLAGAALGPSPFGSSYSGVSATTSTGDETGFTYGDGWIYVPFGYASGAALSDSMTLDDTTIGDLELSPGDYTVLSWTSGSIVVDIVGDSVPTPEPSVAALLATPLLLVFGLLRSRRATPLYP